MQAKEIYNPFIERFKQWQLKRIQAPKVAKFKETYFDIRSGLDRHIATFQEEEKFHESINNDDFSAKISDRYRNLCGVEGGGYVLIDKPNGRIFFIQNQLLKKERNQNIPFHALPYRIALRRELLPNNYSQEDRENLMSWLIDSMFEGYYDNMPIDHDEKKAPNFIKNMPPQQNHYSFEPLPFERVWREKKRIEVLYCYMGEIMFFLYAWRLLLWNARILGFDGNIDLTLDIESEKEQIKISGMKFSKIWERASWGDTFNYTPEKKWLEKLTEYERWWDDGHNIDSKRPPFEEVKKLWKELTKLTDTSPSGHFMDKEWEHLGLNKNARYEKQVSVSLLSYTRHIVRTIRCSEDLAKVSAFFPDKIETVQEINQAIDYTLLLDKEHRDKYINIIFGPKGKSDTYWYYALRKVICSALWFESGKEVSEWSIRTLFKSLHNKVRFPILPLYYQIAASADRAPREFMVCPVARSFSNAVELPFTKNPIDGTVYKTHKIAFAMLTVKPIQVLDKDFTLTKNKKYYSDQPDAEISDISILRIRCVQDFATVISQQMVDKGFYDKMIRRETVDETIRQQFVTQSHEIYKIVRFIDSQMPPFVLSEIRSYFVIMFASVNYVLDEIQSESTFPKEFSIPDSYFEMLLNAAKFAKRLETLEYLCMNGSIYGMNDVDFNQEIEAGFNREQIIIDTPPKELLLFDEYEKRVTALYFFMTLIVVFKNIYKHKKIGTRINVHFDQVKKVIKFINNMKEESSEQLSEKDHPGSTKEAMDYFVEKYAPGSGVLFEKKRSENDLWLTQIPFFPNSSSN